MLPVPFHEKHEGLARTVAAHYPSLDYDDAVQEARIALWQAESHYDPTRGSEVVFARRVIENRLRTLAVKPRLRAIDVDPSWCDVDRHSHDDLDAAVSRLPLSWQRDVDLVYGLRGSAFPVHIVAALQGVTKQAVSTRVRKALAQLKGYLQ